MVELDCGDERGLSKEKRLIIEKSAFEMFEEEVECQRLQFCRGKKINQRRRSLKNGLSCKLNRTERIQREKACSKSGREMNEH